MENFDLLKNLCCIHAPSGNEIEMKRFLLEYLHKHQHQWKVKPKVIEGKQFQDCMIWEFGTSRTAIFAHMDSIGFTVRYKNQLVKIGGPVIIDGTKLIGEDSKGKILGYLHVNKETDELSIYYEREIDRGTELLFYPEWRETEDFIQCCYMDNRLGIWNALKVAETLENGAIVFSCWEEHGGGSVGYLASYLYNELNVQQALISDITWVTEGVKHGEGAAISIRDRGIPRRSFINKIIQLSKESGIPFQLEVEGAGSSDGGYLQSSPYPFDWCFIGAPEDHVHTPDEKVHKKDIASMWKLYQMLMNKL